MDYFREEYPNVVFLWVSDDMEWAKNQINNKHGDIYFVGKLVQEGAHLEALEKGVFLQHWRSVCTCILTSNFDLTGQKGLKIEGLIYDVKFLCRVSE